MDAKGQFRLRVLILVVLFAAAIGGWVFIATGKIDAAMTSPAIVILYLILGLLVGVVTFGVLQSSAQINGQRYGFAISAGGPFAAVLLVLAGCVVAENYRPQSFQFAVALRQNGAAPPLDGVADCVVWLRQGTWEGRAQVTGNAGAHWPEIPSDRRDREAEVEVKCGKWRTKERPAKTKLRSKDSATIEVEPDPGYCSAKEASEQQGHLHEQLAGLTGPFTVFGRDYVQAARSGDPRKLVGEQNAKDLEVTLGQAQGIAEALEKLPDCLTDFYQADRFADASLGWTMAALYARLRRDMDRKVAPDRLAKARTAETKARAFYAKVRKDDAMRAEAERRVGLRLALCTGYRLAITDPVAHEAEIRKLALDAKQAHDDPWDVDLVLGPILEKP